MDAQRFDSIVRRLGARSTRRETVRGLLAGSLAVALGGAAALDASAGSKKKLGDKCSSKDQCPNALLCKKSNSQNSCYAKTEERCCKPLGARCNDGCACCGVDVICNGHICEKA